MKGILFKPWKIKAIAENPDREWQTRRIFGLEGINKEPDKYRLYAAQLANHSSFAFYSGPDNPLRFARPRYLPGETVYIKEAWRVEKENPIRTLDTGAIYDYAPPTIMYKLAKQPHIAALFHDWKSPMFMPVRYARYFIKILDARPERLQEITEEDAIAEGITKSSWEWDIAPYRSVIHIGVNAGRSIATAAYMDLWDSINPKTPWASNPWVWKYTFKLTESK